MNRVARVLAAMTISIGVAFPAHASTVIASGTLVAETYSGLHLELLPWIAQGCSGTDVQPLYAIIDVRNYMGKTIKFSVLGMDAGINAPAVFIAGLKSCDPAESVLAAPLGGATSTHSFFYTVKLPYVSVTASGQNVNTRFKVEG